MKLISQIINFINILIIFNFGIDSFLVRVLKKRFNISGGEKESGFSTFSLFYFLLTP